MFLCYRVVGIVLISVLQLTKAELEVVDRQAAKRRRRGLNA